MSRAVARSGIPRMLAAVQRATALCWSARCPLHSSFPPPEATKIGVQRATALCRSARCPRFILPSRRRRRQKGSAEGDSPLPEREVSSLHPSFPPPQAAKREFATALHCDPVLLSSKKKNDTLP